MNQEIKVELLAPAGSFESMKAAIHAGADAVYMGGSKFGARAYANNPEEDKLIEAINYVHLYGKQLYLTVNTLMKENELNQELYDYLLPLYEAGLDAVIVQDLGTLSFIKKHFPNLPIHASTQMTITGEYGAKELERLGATRVVTARELSLQEIRNIKEQCNVEIESFIHGALCYCYSGQCLFSSIVGGRSGNRGRCAQPCRMPYQVSEGSRVLANEKEGFVLSPKDLNTLAIIPDIIEAGVFSLKIEGRMKKPEYTAGVVSIYRKYIDMYLENGRKGFVVDKKDEQILFDLFNRKGFTEGYYKKHNGNDMITITKPDFRVGNEALTKHLNETYVNGTLKRKIKGKVVITKNTPATLQLFMGEKESNPVTITALGEVPSLAQKKPLSCDDVKKQISKMGNTPFELEHLELQVEDGLFLPVVKLNELRRETLEQLEQAYYSRFKRAIEKEGKKEKIQEVCHLESNKHDKILCFQGITVFVSNKEQLEVVLGEENISIVYVDSLLCEAKEYKAIVEQIKRVGKKAYLALPQIFRREGKVYFNTNWNKIEEANFDGWLVGSLEEIGFLKEKGIVENVVLDHMLYAYNKEAESIWKEIGGSKLTLPVELNYKEMKQRGGYGLEMIVYGHLPMMVSAQCIKKTTKGCDRKETTLKLKDRLNNIFLVENHCRYCYNTIYNSKPLLLLKEKNEIKSLQVETVRLNFTMEDKAKTKEVLKMFVDTYIFDKNIDNKISDFTRGHYKRGVE